MTEVLDMAVAQAFNVRPEMLTRDQIVVDHDNNLRKEADYDIEGMIRDLTMPWNGERGRVLIPVVATRGEGGLYHLQDGYRRMAGYDAAVEQGIEMEEKIPVYVVTKDQSEDPLFLSRLDEVLNNSQKSHSVFVQAERVANEFQIMLTSGMEGKEAIENLAANRKVSLETIKAQLAFEGIKFPGGSVIVPTEIREATLAGLIGSLDSAKVAGEKYRAIKKKSASYPMQEWLGLITEGGLESPASRKFIQDCYEQVIASFDDEEDEGDDESGESSESTSEALTPEEIVEGIKLLQEAIGGFDLGDLEETKQTKVYAHLKRAYDSIGRVVSSQKKKATDLEGKVSKKARKRAEQETNTSEAEMDF
jgi:hypothetical protein